ncbi:diguanylate cyclase [Amphibacillus marinus]|uniref:Diguanylate cyclase n=1 Tax=Amphibacillus marinus TaxID=872970 RepID=A0A1H8L881_9BACI|nr:GGDEF domain-containing protein [Amphibacillus marinus]SEO01390.1 diguanylate cyclase [Amphibacillus marinus]
MIDIFSGLFINATIMISAVTIVSILLNSHLYTLNSITKEISIGVIAGLLGCSLILYSVSVTEGQLIDFRLIPIALVAIHYSRRAAILTAVMINIFRLTYYGVNISSIVAITAVSVVTVATYFISKLEIPRHEKWIYVVLTKCLVAGVSFHFLLRGEGFFNVIIPYCSGLVILSFLVYTFTEYFTAVATHYEKVIVEAQRDYLTGLLNLRQFTFLYERLLKDKKLTSKKIAVLFIDVDLFKAVNDRFGHITGDLVLIEVSKVLEKVCSPHGIVARRGGDEFVALFENIGYQAAEEIALQLKDEVSKLKFNRGSSKEFGISITVGISAYPETVQIIQQLLNYADINLYEHKGQREANK